ncbi:MAG: tRNA pseudouridine(55) synthase TruB, partial [Clostridia bacterium]|nr:tRNA pseudouridine(55) synthase TruB [Clostridia bacterium]
MDGILIINKEQGKTSHDIVYKVKKILNEKVGHTGTLDPNATGVLPLLIGKGTQCSQYLIEHDKTYEVKLKLGIKTDTADIEGNIIEEKNIIEENLKEEKVKNVLKSFIGGQKQIPPMYSAIKVNGRKLYEYARKGQTIELKPRNIIIYKCELIKIDKSEKEIDFKVHCSKGTYIRSLCEDIAKKLGTVGYMKNLNRVKVGTFSIDNSLTIEQLEKNYQNKDFINKYFITIEQLFMERPFIIMNEHKM